MSTLFRCPPVTFVKHNDPTLLETSIIGKEVGKNYNSSATRDASSALLRDDHIVLLAIDALLALHASFKKWRKRRRTLQALADLDERQLRDIGLTRDEVLLETSPKLVGHHNCYRALSGLDEKQLSDLSELGLRGAAQNERPTHHR